MLGRYDIKNYDAWIQWSQYIGEELIGKEMDVNYNEWGLCYMKRKWMGVVKELELDESCDECRGHGWES
jgi:hypothetical protein